jgi:hypothetical protein
MQFETLFRASTLWGKSQSLYHHSLSLSRLQMDRVVYFYLTDRMRYSLIDWDSV